MENITMEEARDDVLELIKDNFTLEAEEIEEIKEELEIISYNGYGYITIEGSEYRIISENDIEGIFAEEIEETVRDCYLGNSDLPEWITNHIDWEGIASECMVDGYGYHFNSYDGGEIEGNGFYLFQN